MDILQIIKSRRAVKHYDKNFEIPKQDLDILLEHAILAPTSFNIQHWRLVLVKDQNVRKQIREAAWDQAQITDSSLLFILCADIKAWNKNPERYWQNAPQETQDILLPMIKNFYEGKEQLQRDEAIRSTGIIAQNMMLTAKSMGYDSCPMIGFDSDKVAKIINLPPDHLIGMILAIGKGTKKAFAKSGQLKLEEILINDKF